MHQHRVRQPSFGQVMKQELGLTRARLKTPRAAAIAGIVFSVLLMTSLVLVRLSVPADPRLEGERG